MRRPQQDDTLEYSGKDWRFAVSAAFVRGTTPALRRKGQKVHELSAMARMLYVYLMSFVGPNSPAAFPSLRRIEWDLSLNASTIKKYRRELESAGFLVRKQLYAQGRFGSNRYTLTDGSAVKSSPTVKRSAEKSSGEGSPSKSNHVLKSSQMHEVQKPGREKSVPGGTPPPPPVLLPSAAVARAMPEQKTEGLLSEWKTWYAQFYGRPLIMDTNQKRKVVAFFKEYPDVQARELLALALKAWRAAEAASAQEYGEKDYWFIINKSKLPGDLVNNISSVTGELGWKLTQTTDEKIEKSLQRTKERIQQKEEDRAQQAQERGASPGACPC